jgi:hypothetical protein
LPCQEKPSSRATTSSVRPCHSRSNRVPGFSRERRRIVVSPLCFSSSASYDDGGFSGGNIERPALQRLLADIGTGRVDIVVVYKVDRLTRSLADFARLVEIFDAQSVSFVSVTQQFNTTSSMGRLTLNVLLSFARFEREVTDERIRDKIAASKKKGMWMGGNVPLGYDANERTLVINPAGGTGAAAPAAARPGPLPVSDMRSLASATRGRSPAMHPLCRDGATAHAGYGCRAWGGARAPPC